MSIENQVLNKVLKTQSISFFIENNITEDYFPIYKDQFNFILNHYQQFNKVPDTLTFLEKFKDFEVFEVNESDDYLKQTIQENYLYMQMVPVIRKAHDLTKDDANEAVKYMSQVLPQLQMLVSSPSIDLVNDGADNRLNNFIDKREDGSKVIKAGFNELNDIIHGWEKGEELVCLFARLNAGKSWILCKFGIEAFLQNYNVGIYSGEMSAQKVGYRFDTLMANFSNTALIRGYNERSEEYVQYIERLKQSKNHFHIVTRKELGGRATVSKLKNLVEKHNLDILLVDQYSLMDDERAKKNDDNRIRYAHISEDLFNMSCEYRIPIIAAAQANRAGAKKGKDSDDSPPDIEHIAESDSIAQNSSKCIAIRQKDGFLEMQVRKNRESGLGEKLIYSWDIDIGKFSFVRSGDDFNSSANNISSNYNQNDAIMKTGIEVF